MSANAKSEAQEGRCLGDAGSNESWGAGGKCRYICRSATLDAESSKF